MQIRSFASLNGIKDRCHSFSLISSLVVYIKLQLNYNQFCSDIPILGNHITGCNGNHAFSGSLNRSIFRKIVFAFRGPK